MNLPRIVRGSRAQEYPFREGCAITEWLNDDADPALSVARARVAPGVTTRWHSLTETTERYVILSGAGRVELNYGALIETLTPGDSVLIPPGCPQRITNNDEDDLVFLAICTPRFRHAAYIDLDDEAAQASPL